MMLKTQPLVAQAESQDVNASSASPAASAYQEGLGSRFARLIEVYCYWLTGQRMSQQDWTTWEVRRSEAFLRSATNGLVKHLSGLVAECPCCAL